MKFLPLSILTLQISIAVISVPTMAMSAPDHDTKPVVPPNSLDSKAKDYVKNLPQDPKKLTARDPSLGGEKPVFINVNRNSGLQLLDEIRVTAGVDPEDYVVPKPAPMLVFRAKLDSMRPKSFCFICPITLSEPGNISDRTDERAHNPPSFIYQR